MSSITLTLSGDSSHLSAQYFPAINLSDGEYVCGLVDFHTFNSIPNIDETNNSFYIGYAIGDDNISDINNKNIDIKSERDDDKVIYDQSNESKEVRTQHKRRKRTIVFNPPTRPRLPLTHIQIPIGSYEVAHLENYLKTRLKEINQEVTLELHANHNTLKCEIRSNQPIDFTKPNTFSSLLGFHNNLQLDADRWYESQLPADILKVNVIRVRCNIITGSYMNDQLSHSIHEFSPRVEPGHKITEVPHNVIYFPVTVRNIQTLDISFVDQNNQLINFRGETITVRLHIKKLNQ